MYLAFLKWLTVVFALVMVSSFVSMMASFVGSEGEDLRDLLILQTGLIPAALAVVAWRFRALFRAYGTRRALPTFWTNLPGWLLFVVVAANSLVLAAELSFFLIRFHTGVANAWQEHIPAVTALSSSVALATCYVSYRLAGGGRPSATGRGRGRLRGSEAG